MGQRGRTRGPGEHCEDEPAEGPVLPQHLPQEPHASANAPPRARPLADALPDEFQREVVLPYDQTVHPFGDALNQVLGEGPGADLGQLHVTGRGREVIGAFQRRPKEVVTLGPRDNPWNRRYHACAQVDPAAFNRFMAVYHEFLRSFVLQDLRTDRVAFQASPTFRCHLPWCGAPGRPHRDEDYRHPRCEVNYWIPLTAVFGSNSLYAESRRDACDFRPFELSPGALVRFYGNQVWHYTIPNETDCTRVSIDFRVIREQEWSIATFSDFQLGAYYAVMTRSGVLPYKSPEIRALQEEFQCVPPPKKMKGKGAAAAAADDAQATAAVAAVAPAAAAPAPTPAPASVASPASAAPAQATAMAQAAPAAPAAPAPAAPPAPAASPAPAAVTATTTATAMAGSAA